MVRTWVTSVKASLCRWVQRAGAAAVAVCRGRAVSGALERGGVSAARCHWPRAGTLLPLTSPLVGTGRGLSMWHTSRETLALEESTSWADCDPFFCCSAAGSCCGISVSVSAGGEQPLPALPSVWTWQIKCASCAWLYCCVLLPWASLAAALLCLMTRDKLLAWCWQK